MPHPFTNILKAAARDKKTVTLAGKAGNVFGGGGSQVIEIGTDKFDHSKLIEAMNDATFVVDMNLILNLIPAADQNSYPVSIDSVGGNTNWKALHDFFNETNPLPGNQNMAKIEQHLKELLGFLNAKPEYRRLLGLSGYQANQVKPASTPAQMKFDLRKLKTAAQGWEDKAVTINPETAANNMVSKFTKITGANTDYSNKTRSDYTLDAAAQLAIDKQTQADKDFMKALVDKGLAKPPVLGKDTSGNVTYTVSVVDDPNAKFPQEVFKFVMTNKDNTWEKGEFLLSDAAYDNPEKLRDFRELLAEQAAKSVKTLKAADGKEVLELEVIGGKDDLSDYLLRAEALCNNHIVPKLDQTLSDAYAKRGAELEGAAANTPPLSTKALEELNRINTVLDFIYFAGNPIPDGAITNFVDSKEVGISKARVAYASLQQTAKQEAEIKADPSYNKSTAESVEAKKAALDTLEITRIRCNAAILIKANQEVRVPGSTGPIATAANLGRIRSAAVAQTTSARPRPTII
jgi:hypothetical protein